MFSNLYFPKFAGILCHFGFTHEQYDCRILPEYFNVEVRNTAMIPDQDQNNVTTSHLFSYILRSSIKIYGRYFPFLSFICVPNKNPCKTFDIRIQENNLPYIHRYYFRYHNSVLFCNNITEYNKSATSHSYHITRQSLPEVIF